jgi:hypothetical protein
MRALTEYAERRCKPKSLVAEAAIASFLSPDAAERQEATLVRRLDRITRQLERLERDVGISAETVALFIRFWLMAAPSLPDQSKAEVRVKGAERCEGFMQALGRRLAKGPNFIRDALRNAKNVPFLIQIQRKPITISECAFQERAYLLRQYPRLLGSPVKGLDGVEDRNLVWTYLPLGKSGICH